MKGKKVIKEKYYECPRCKINSRTKDVWCPCPRGGCEAVVTGTIVITEKLIKHE